LSINLILLFLLPVSGGRESREGGGITETSAGLSKASSTLHTKSFGRNGNEVWQTACCKEEAIPVEFCYLLVSCLFWDTGI